MVVKYESETGGYKKRIKVQRRRNKYIWIVIPLTFCMVAAISFYVQGVRFDALQAANSNPYINKDSELLGEVEVNPYKVFFYENDDKYRTVITEKTYFLWKNTSSSWANKTDDKIKMAGWCSMSGSKTGMGVTAIPVQNHDNQAAYIEMGPNDDRQKKAIPYGETVIFAWDKSIRWNDINAIAYNEDGKPLYELGYETVNDHISIDELRWLPYESID